MREEYTSQIPGYSSPQQLSVLKWKREFENFLVCQLQNKTKQQNIIINQYILNNQKQLIANTKSSPISVGLFSHQDYKAGWQTRKQWT